MPGEIIVADNDGVAVVPRAKADKVAEIARCLYTSDELSRAAICKRIGRLPDWTVEGHAKPAPPSDEPLHETPVWQK